jgi:hypothetical protein
VADDQGVAPDDAAEALAADVEAWLTRFSAIGETASLGRREVWAGPEPEGHDG